MIVLPVQGLTPDENKEMLACLQQLTAKRPRALLRDSFYNTRKILDRVGFSIPPSMANLDAVIGWPTKAVDGLSGRLHLSGFVQPGKSQALAEAIADVFADNKMAAEWPQVQTSTMKHGCAFVSTTPGDVEAGEPKTLILTMPATEATGIWDVRTRRLRSALWVPDTDQMMTKTAVLFTQQNTVQMTRGLTGPWQIKRVPNLLPRLPVVPVVHRPQLGRPFGASRISRSVMYLCQMAARTLLRTEVSAEFYSSPQRYAMGAKAEDFEDGDGNTVSAWETILGRTWLIDRDDEGNVPNVGQFPQMTMQPHIDMMKMITTLFAGETALPTSSLGIVHDNPASAAAIDAAWADMVQLAELCQPELGTAAVEIAQNAHMVEEGLTEVPDELRRLKAKWRNAATPTLAAQTDAVSKQIGVGQLQPDSRVGLEAVGYDEVDVIRIEAEHAAAKAAQQDSVSQLVNGVTGAGRDLAAQAAEQGAAGAAGAGLGSGLAPARPGGAGRVGAGVAGSGDAGPAALPAGKRPARGAVRGKPGRGAGGA